MNKLEKYNKSIFETIKQVNEYGAEFWFARNLAEVLNYSKWANSEKVIEKAKESCKNSHNNASDHFADVGKTINMPKGAKREIQDIMFFRYACYLIVQNAYPRKEIVALGQTYFAIQTRKQELLDELEQLDEDRKRVSIRNVLNEHNKYLADVAKNAGVVESKDYAVFQNYGYMGLYGGKDIHARKKLKKSHKILDHMGSTELAANLFRATQTEEKLRRENIKGKAKANITHHQVGAKVRKSISELGGTILENLPTPDKSVKKLEMEQKKLIE